MTRTSRNSVELTTAHGSIGEKKRSAPLVLWEQDPNSEYDSDSEFVQDGPRLWINHSFEVHAFNWHRKGDYFSSVCPQDILLFALLLCVVCARLCVRAS